MTQKVGVVGAGAWGTAIAQTLALSGNEVLLWAREHDVVKSINKNRENPLFLPNITLSENISCTDKLEDIPIQCSTIFFCNPAFATTEISAYIGSQLKSNHSIVICSKGMRETDGNLLHQVWAEVCPQLRNIAVLGGPSFAMELAQEKPSSMVVASKIDDVTEHIGKLFSAGHVKIYYSRDVIGVQVGGCLKNIIAIGSGISDALELGKNARAAIICRGLLEMKRYAKALGGEEETLTGLSGLGDVLLSSTSDLSRNYRFGRCIGKNMPLQKALDMVGGQVEGIRTARIVTAQGAGMGIDLAIISAIDGIVSGDIQAEKAMKLLMSRPRSWEFDD